MLFNAIVVSFSGTFVAKVARDVIVVTPPRMPIFWLMSFISGGGRSARFSPLQNLSMEIAASCPCATAQMMFFGLKAASPPKNTHLDRRLKRGLVQHWKSPIVEFQTQGRVQSKEKHFLAQLRSTRRRTQMFDPVRLSVSTRGGLVILWSA